jgi:hypothetical protein
MINFKYFFYFNQGFSLGMLLIGLFYVPLNIFLTASIVYLFYTIITIKCYPEVLK